MNEVWKPVPSSRELEASSFGRIRSRPYTQKMPNGGTRTRRLEPTHGVESYSRKGGKYRRRIVVFRRKTLNVARLICEAFHGKPPNGRTIVLHKDENSDNNRPYNLEWGTQRENMNAPGFLAYCEGRTGDSSPRRKSVQS